MADNSPSLYQRGVYWRLDIMIEMYQKGELQEAVEVALAS